MALVIESAVRPRLSAAVELVLDDHVLRIEDGRYRATIPAPSLVRSDLDPLTAGLAPVELIDRCRNWFGLDDEQAIAFVEHLFRSGLLVDPEAGALDAVPGLYVACRLVDTFHREFPRVLAGSPLLDAFAGEPARGLALGFLLETYFVVRTARWSAQPVFRHDLTPVQREALRDFDDSESGHGELLLSGFGQIGFDVDRLRWAQEATETLAYSHTYGAWAWQGVAEFAASLVLPEVPMATPGGTGRGVDVLDLLEDKHGVPSALIRKYRLHDADDVEGDHGNLPGTLLAEEKSLSPAKVAKLFAVLRQTMDLYRSHLDGVHRRYASVPLDERSGVFDALPDNALRY